MKKTIEIDSNAVVIIFNPQNSKGISCKATIIPPDEKDFENNMDAYPDELVILAKVIVDELQNNSKYFTFLINNWIETALIHHPESKSIH